MEDFLGDLLVGPIVNAVLSPFFRAVLFLLGFVYLYLRYQRPQRVQEQLVKDYGASYVTAGGVALRGLLQALIIGLILFLWLGAAYSMIFS
ncbi:hypothetical protein [Hymenobacter rigui]|uniref:Uncharacterized protein n=1 Tax=Hymenobacter rigui TaxID=334424 RepID=A0A428KRC4_9BACT|nr:hypothetical protein [Hymenobacter rigui]RSK49026.1 hypothetical protein EI291_10750 [Hymenobacter rigui]